MPEQFHARFSARGKVYRYRVWCGEVLPPVELDRAWHVTRRVDVDLATRAAKLFEGEHDFTAFAANRGKPETDTRRHIRAVRVRTRGGLLEIEIEADGFLYKMARMIAGAVIDCGTGKVSLADIRGRLRREKTSARTVAPAAGLFLVRVRY